MKKLFCILGFALTATLSFGQAYNLKIYNISGLPAAVNVNDTVPFFVGVQNEDIAGYVGPLTLYYKVKQDSPNTLRYDSLTSILSSDTAYYPTTLIFSIPPFYPADNIVTIWPVGGGFNVNPIGDSMSVNIFIDTIMSAREHLFAEKYYVIIYPNPTQGKIFIHSTGGSQTQPEKVFLYDLNGKLIQKTDLRKTDNLDLRKIDVAQGNYVVDIVLKNGKRYSAKILYFPK